MDKMNEYLESMRKSMYRKKGLFVEMVQEALWSDQESSNVIDCEYGHSDDYEPKEWIRIRFFGGHEAWINVNGNSNGANLKEIYKAVYGDGAFGEMRGAPIKVR